MILLNKWRGVTVLILWAALAIFASGCSLFKKPAPEIVSEKTTSPRENRESIPPAPSKAETPPSEAPPPPEQKPDARMTATANLVEQGKNYLENGKPDQALNVLERALSVYPGNGRTYYYMAEAWVMKKNKHQAMEFNRLALMYLSADHQWRDKVADQRRRIEILP